MKNNNKNKDLVTIVTVTYNAEELLEATINSVINQTYKEIEYIIIDGGSTDNTLEIIKKYEEQINYWISEPDDGIYYAMNKAIEKANGKWINFMNAGDSFVDSGTVEKVINYLDNTTELIYGEHITNGKVCSVEHRKNISRSMPCCHQSIFVKMNLMKQNSYNTSYKISADYDFVLKMYHQGRNIKYIREPFSHYLGDGISDQNTTLRELETLALYINNGVNQNEIINSSAYKNIQKRSLYTTNQRKKIHKIEKLQKIKNEFKNTSFYYYPILKIKILIKFFKLCRKV